MRRCLVPVKAEPQEVLGGPNTYSEGIWKTRDITLSNSLQNGWPLNDPPVLLDSIPNQPTTPFQESSHLARWVSPAGRWRLGDLPSSDLNKNHPPKKKAVGLGLGWLFAGFLGKKTRLTQILVLWESLDPFIDLDLLKMLAIKFKHIIPNGGFFMVMNPMVHSVKK